jgi:hypothetical protein
VLKGEARDEFDKWIKSCKELAKNNGGKKNEKKKND